MPDNIVTNENKDIKLILSGKGPHKIPKGVKVMYIHCIHTDEPIQFEVGLRMDK